MRTVFSLAAAVAAFAGSAARAQCGVPGADATIGRINGSNYYAPHAWSVGFDVSNLGNAVQSIMFATNDHPYVAANLYRLKTVDGSSRFEQIGMSWGFHLYFGLESGGVCTCSSVGNGNIGPGCSDPETASSAGNRDVLGPRFEVNAWTGQFPFPFASPAFGTDSRARRLQAAADDVNPANNAGALYFVEDHVISADDSLAANQHNNASYRRCAFPTGTNLTLMESTVRAQPAIRAWKLSDAAVVESDILVPGEGLFVVAAKATDLGNGTWHYEYAVYNHNSHRSARAFTLPLPAGVTVTNIGFHDVDYHSGDGLNSVNVDGADWTAVLSADGIEWSTQTFAANENANALRWGTLYNFRFDADVAPADGQAELGLYRPGAPEAVLTGLIPIPGAGCAPDFDGDGFITGADFDLYVQAFEAGETTADFDHDGFITGADYDLYVQAYEAGC